MSNVNGSTSSRLDALITWALSIMDEAPRRALLGQAVRVAAGDGAVIPLLRLGSVAGAHL